MKVDRRQFLKGASALFAIPLLKFKPDIENILLVDDGDYETDGTLKPRKILREFLIQVQKDLILKNSILEEQAGSFINRVFLKTNRFSAKSELSRKHISFLMPTTERMMMSLKEFSDKWIKPSAKAMSNEINKDIMRATRKYVLKSDFILVTRELELPEQITFTGREVHKGMTARIMEDYDIGRDRDVMRFDIAYFIAKL